MIYILLILFCSSIVYRAYDVSLGPNHISFSIENSVKRVYAGVESQFSITGTSGGSRDVSFYLVLTSANATLLVEGEPGYIQMNKTAIKIPFSFNGSGKEIKPIHFTVDANVTSFELYPSFEHSKDRYNYLIMASLGEIYCMLDPTTDSYTVPKSLGWPVP